MSESVLAVVTQLAALVTLLAAVIYILGVVALGWSIQTKVTHYVPATLQALSVIPKTVVAGQGLTLFLGLPAVVTFVWILMAILQSVALIIVLFFDWGAYWAQIPSSPLYSLVLILIASFVLILLLRWIDRNPHLRGVRTLSQRFRLSLASAFWTIVFLALGAVLSLLAGPRIANALFITGSGWDIYFAIDWRLALVGLALVFLSAFLIGVPIALSIDPPLLTAKITIQDEVNSAKQTITAKLVGRSEGVWYYFNDRGTLVSVPAAIVEFTKDSFTPAE